MAFQEELNAPTNCPDCGTAIPIKVCMSSRGYYIGQYCNRCGPYSRLSFYYNTSSEAQRELENNTWQRRDTVYNKA